MSRILEENKRKEVVSLLLEFGITEAHDELNRFIDKRDKENALRLSKVSEAVDVLLNYFEN